MRFILFKHLICLVMMTTAVSPAFADCRESLQSKTPASVRESWPDFLGYIRAHGQHPIEGKIREEWGPKPGDQSNRLRIREALSQKLVFSNDIFDLSEPPLMLLGSVSIAHTFGMGGYIYSPKDRVGFDVEQVKRIDNIDQGIFNRILAPSETASLSLPNSVIWAIKEAAFKALSNPKLTLLADLEITHVEIVEQNYFYLQGRSLKGPTSLFEGWAKIIGPHVLAVVVKNPTSLRP